MSKIPVLTDEQFSDYRELLKSHSSSVFYQSGPLSERMLATYMGVARLHGNLSRSTRAKVGACLVTSDGVIIPGFNGTPHGDDNNCEGDDGNTKNSVIHAELNCIMKAAKEGISIKDSVLYVTMIPCDKCAAMIIQSGIRTVVFSDPYRDLNGLKYLMERIDVYHWDNELGELGSLRHLKFNK